ncbi:MAG TPA: AMP-binding protein [Thermodesulfobacteriota bacterium]
MTVADLLALPAEAAPDQPAVTFAGRSLRYRQMWQRATLLAGALAAQGVGRGDVVGIMATNSPAFVDVLFASALLGATFVPLNYRAKRDELAHLLADARVAVLFREERYAELVAAAAAGVPSLRRVYGLDEGSPSAPSLRDLARGAVPLGVAAGSGDDVAVLMYTSGTTGLPKPVRMRHDGLVSYVLGAGEMADGRPRGANLIAAPLYHIAGLSALLTSLFGGLRAVLLPQFDAEAWLRTVEAERITHAFLVPTMLKLVLDHPSLPRTDLASLRLVSYGAAPMPTPVILEAIETLPRHVSFSQSFGQTETLGTVSVLGPEDHRLEGAPDVVERRRRRLASVGRPLPDVEVRIVAEGGAEAPRGTVGEVLVRSARVAAPESADGSGGGGTGWHHTGDLGWLDEDGYLFLAGRRKDLIIRAGENIAPAEIEVVLASHPLVDSAAAVGLPDEQWGERVVAAIVPRAGAGIDAAELLAYCRARLASYKVPERIVVVPELPRNGLGKVQKNVLKDTLLGVTVDADQNR